MTLASQLYCIPTLVLIGLPERTIRASIGHRRYNGWKEIDVALHTTNRSTMQINSIMKIQPIRVVARSLCEALTLERGTSSHHL